MEKGNPCYRPRMNRTSITVLILFVVITAIGAPVTPERINELPEEQRTAWRNYLAQSQTNALADAAALKAEVAAHKMTNALRAPSGGDFKLTFETGDPWYAGAEARQLVPVILSYQTPAGGWSKHTGYSKGARQPGMQWTSQNEPGQKPHYLATFDNGSTTEQLHFLANFWHATKNEDCETAFIKGLNFILAAQYPNGGWPQVYPLEGGYHDDITFNDDAMTHILELLYAITSAEPQFDFLDSQMRNRVRAAFASGINCVFKTQIVRDGNKTGWCSQFDPLSLQPSSARKMEPATLGGTESAAIVKFLMTITNPAPELVASIEGGLKWLENAKITGLTRTNLNGKTAYVSDAASTKTYWARFYNLTNNQPVFPGRDGVVYESFAAMAARNDLGYDYFSTQPGSIINTGQKKWRKMLANQAKN
jgi:PelA/Pel-15E family pectate lyase